MILKLLKKKNDKEYNEKKQSYTFCYPWKQKCFDENILKLETFILDMEKLGWKVIYNERINCDKLNTKDIQNPLEKMASIKYRKFIELHNKLVFYKST